MNTTDKIYVAGHHGMVGGAIKRNLEQKGYTNIVYRTSKELDLRDQTAVNHFFETEQPAYVFLAAAHVGGIMANSKYRADFLYDNLMIAANVISAAHRFSVKKLLFLGSSCIYPKFAHQPIAESELLKGELEPTNEPYAIAKITGIKLCEAYRDQFGDNFISVQPTNLYGLGDNYHPEHSHVLPALIRRFHEAKENNADKVTIWGTGKPLREFLYSEDLADACVHLMNSYDGKELVNIGVGEDLSIGQLAQLIKEVVGFEGSIDFDTSKPDGTPRKLLNVSKLNNLGWKARTSLREGIEFAYADYLSKIEAHSLRTV